MPDITMCANVDCTLKKYCYRATADPSPVWQSYAGFTQQNDGSCEHFWDNEEKTCKNIKRFGEGCPWNNNCRFPRCLIDGHWDETSNT